MFIATFLLLQARFNIPLKYLTILKSTQYKFIQAVCSLQFKSNKYDEL